MTDIIPFDYSQLDTETGAFVQNKTELMRQEIGTIKARIGMLGAYALEVRTALPHGKFMAWANSQFPGFSHQTVINWITWHIETSKRPELESLPMATVYRLTSQIPENVKDKILDTPEQVNAILFTHRIENLVSTDPGMALHQITNALENAELRETARGLIIEHAETFAILADETPQETMAQAGMNYQDRNPTTGNHRTVNLELVEEGDSAYILGWPNDGQRTERVLTFHQVRNRGLQNWQRALIDLAIDRLRLKIKADRYHER